MILLYEYLLCYKISNPNFNCNVFEKEFLKMVFCIRALFMMTLSFEKMKNKIKVAFRGCILYVKCFSKIS